MHGGMWLKPEIDRGIERSWDGVQSLSELGDGVDEDDSSIIPSPVSIASSSLFSPSSTCISSSFSYTLRYCFFRVSIVSSSSSVHCL